MQQMDPSVETITAFIAGKCNPPHGAACTDPKCQFCRECSTWADVFEDMTQLDVQRLKRTVAAAQRNGMAEPLKACLFQVSRLAAAREPRKEARDFFAEVESARRSLAVAS